jgi:hypothetical protein
VSVYKVTARTGYRGHPKGNTFEAVLEPRVEERAIKRGDILLLERSTPSIKAKSFTLPTKQPKKKATRRKKEA